MKIYVITDLEGPAMVFSFDQTRLPEATERIAQAKRFLTREVNACVDGILDVDAAAEVVVLDGHGSGGIDYELFHEQAQLIAGYRRPSFACLDETYDALFFVGQHAMAGTPAAPLAHTQSSRTIEYYRLNGELIGEFAQHAILAGTLFGVPTAFLSGDDKAVAEAQTLAPALVGVVTKVGLGLEAARSVSPRRAQKLIRAGAAEACRRVRARAIPPLRVAPPYELEIRVLPGQEARLAGYLQRGFVPVDERTVRRESDDPRVVLS